MSTATPPGTAGRWRPGEGTGVVKPMTPMTFGVYHEPAGSWYPSALF